MVESLYYALFFIVPLIFFPKTSEVFEFNKMVAVYIFTTLIIAAWIISIVRRRLSLRDKNNPIFKRTILDIPLLLFLGSQIISTIISVDQRTSIFGYYSRFNGGLLSTICYALLYWAFVSNMNKKSTITSVYCLLSSAFLVAVYGIMEHFGGSISCVLVTGKFNDDCWIQDVRTRVFATLGQPNWLGAYLTSLVPLSWYFALKTKIQKEKIVWIAISILFFACILFTGSRSGIFALAIACVIFGILNIKKYFKELFLISVLFLIIAGIFGTPITPSISQLIHKEHVKQSVDTSEGGTESGSIRAIVWKGAIDIWKHNPIFGTGVETFGYTYWQFRPVAHNLTSEWDFLYNKAHNEYLNFAANTGTVGLITYLILIGTSTFMLRKNPALLAGYVSILITNFFGFSVVTISLLTFLFPGFAIALNTKEQKNLTVKFKLNMPIGLVLVSSVYLLFAISRYWYADTLYQKARNETQIGDYTNSIKDMQEAINYSPGEGIYHNEMSRIFTGVALGLADAKDATSASEFATLAINESQTAFDLSPRNMNIRETKINTLLELVRFDSSYYDKAISLIKVTIPLSPTDPKLWLILGKAYANQNKFNLAIDALKKALELKPDYADAKLALATVEKLQKNQK